jgi:TRAP-type uncharacterized transport system substrate-binding protein
MRHVGLVTTVMLLPASAASAQPSAMIGTNPPGSALYAVGNALTKVATEAGTARLTVQPYAGSSTFLPMLESGELELGVNNAIVVGLAYNGPGFKIGGRNPFPHTPGLRLAAVIDDVCVVAYDAYVIAGKGASDAVVEGLLTAIWNDGAELAPFHPLLPEWSRDKMAGAEITIPYHPAAVRFYREQKVWTAEVEQAQQRLIKGGR